MAGINEFITPRVKLLVDEANNLKPASPIRFAVMEDPDMLRRSDGGAAQEEDGEQVIYLDLVRANEHVAAHEVMHVILHRSGWPQMFGMIGQDPQSRRIADTIDNVLDHYVFYPRLIELGIDVHPYRDSYVTAFTSWPKNEPQGPALLWNAFTVLDGLLMGEPYRSVAIKALKNRQPTTLQLARALEKMMSPARSRTKNGVRQAMVVTLDFLNRWISEKTLAPANLRERIGVSPRFAQGDLSLPAVQVLELSSKSILLDGRQVWVAQFVLRSDRTCIRTYVSYDSASEPDGVEEIRGQWSAVSLGEILERQAIKYGVI
jgi:hypothetical protein